MQKLAYEQTKDYEITMQQQFDRFLCQTGATGGVEQLAEVDEFFNEQGASTPTFIAAVSFRLLKNRPELTAAVLFAGIRRSAEMVLMDETEDPEPVIEFDPGNKFNQFYQTTLGQALWRLVCSPRATQRMMAMIHLGRPAVLGLEPLILQRKLLPQKQDVAAADKAEFDLALQALGRMAKQRIVYLGGVDTKASKVISNGKLFGSGRLLVFPGDEVDSDMPKG